MKKMLVIILSFVLCFSLFACGSNDDGDNTQPPNTENTQQNEETEEQENNTDGNEQEAEPEENNTEDEEKILKMKISVNGKEFTAFLYDNEAVKKLTELLPLTINMSDLNSNEKYYYLSNNLPTSASNPGTIKTGDIMLWGNNCLVLFYKTFSTSYSYTKIGYIENTTGYAAALGTGNITVTFTKI